MKRYLSCILLLAFMFDARASELFLDGDPVLLTIEQFNQKWPTAFNGIEDSSNGEIFLAVFAPTAHLSVAGVRAAGVNRLYKEDAPCGAGIGFTHLNDVEREAVIDGIKATGSLNAGNYIQITEDSAIIYFESDSAWSSIEYGKERGEVSLVYFVTQRACGENAAEFFRTKPRK